MTLMAVLACASCSGAHATTAQELTLGSALGLGPAPVATDSTLALAAEERVADCMAQQGWEHTPVPVEPMDAPVAESEDATIERLTREGLGVAYGILAADATGDGSADDGDVAPASADPNLAYLATLSEDERQAYDDALYGTEEERAATMATVANFDPVSGAEVRITGSPAGCWAEAWDVLYASMDQTEQVADALRDHWMAIRSAVAADPRTIDLNREWSACMADAGYTFTDAQTFLEVATSRYSARAAEIVGDAYLSDPTAGWTAEEVDAFFATATQADIDTLYSRRAPLTPGQRSDLEDLLAEEVDVALAEHACTAQTGPEAARIAAEVEDTYVHEHEAELLAIAAVLAERD